MNGLQQMLSVLPKPLTEHTIGYGTSAEILHPTRTARVATTLPSRGSRSASLGTSQVSGDGGLKAVGHVNLLANQSKTERQEVMAKTRRVMPPQVSLAGAVGDLSGAQPSFFLRTILLPPRPAPELLSRPRLTER